MERDETEIVFEESGGEVSEAEEGLGESEVAPWMREETASIQNPNFRLHNEIIDFYNYIRPSEESARLRQEAFDRVRSALEKELEGSSVLCFGSFATQLYLPQSDVDIVLLHDTLSGEALTKRVKRILKANPELFLNVDSIKAKVPVIKFTEATSRLEFDLSFNEPSVVYVMQVVLSELRLQPEIKYLVFVLKVALKQRGMNNTFMGGIGSFLLFLLVLAFLSEFKEGKRRSRGGLEKVSLAEYLIEFLAFWGKTFNHRLEEVVFGERVIIRRKETQDDSLRIISPITDDNLGSSAFRFMGAFSMFKNRANFLLNFSFPDKQSILKYLINPSNKNFKQYIE